MDSRYSGKNQFKLKDINTGEIFDPTIGFVIA